MLCTNTGTIGGGESVISRFGGVTTGTAGVSGIAGETSAGGAIGDVIGGVIDGAIGGVIGALSDKNAASSSGASGGKVCGGGTCGSVGCGGCGVWSGSEDGAMTGASSSGSSGDKLAARLVVKAYWQVQNLLFFQNLAQREQERFWSFRLINWLAWSILIVHRNSLT